MVHLKSLVSFCRQVPHQGALNIATTAETSRMQEVCCEKNGAKLALLGMLYLSFDKIELTKPIKSSVQLCRACSLTTQGITSAREQNIIGPNNIRVALLQHMIGGRMVFQKW